MTPSLADPHLLFCRSGWGGWWGMVTKKTSEINLFCKNFLWLLKHFHFPGYGLTILKHLNCHKTLPVIFHTQKSVSFLFRQDVPEHFESVLSPNCLKAAFLNPLRSSFPLSRTEILNMFLLLLLDSHQVDC